MSAMGTQAFGAQGAPKRRESEGGERRLRFRRPAEGENGARGE
jgi:hypothetical protein